jgi:hypothetical protein
MNCTRGIYRLVRARSLPRTTPITHSFSLVLAGVGVFGGMLGRTGALYTHTHANTHSHTHSLTCVCVCVCVYIRVCVYIYIFLYEIHTHTPLVCKIRTHTHSLSHTHAHIRCRCFWGKQDCTKTARCYSTQRWRWRRTKADKQTCCTRSPTCCGEYIKK